jgi:hypothetical protein
VAILSITVTAFLVNFDKLRETNEN